MSSLYMQCQAEFGEYSQLPISGRFLNKEKLLPDRQVLKRSFIVNFQYSAVSLVVLLLDSIQNGHGG